MEENTENQSKEEMQKSLLQQLDDLRSQIDANYDMGVANLFNDLQIDKDKINRIYPIDEPLLENGDTLAVIIKEGNDMISKEYEKMILTTEEKDSIFNYLKSQVTNASFSEGDKKILDAMLRLFQGFLHASLTSQGYKNNIIEMLSILKQKL